MNGDNAPGNLNAARPPNASIVRAIRGPVLLITLGILFMIDYAGGMSFGRSWPILLIVLGILWLGEFIGARNA